MNERNAFKGSLGFVLAAAGSAVGLGNIWRFPYLAAKDGGGIFLLVYFVLLLTFGFALLTTEIAIGRKTKQGPLTAYGYISEKWKHLGILGCLIPAIILPYYCAIGGWVLKYFMIYVNGEGALAAADGFFGGFITGGSDPIYYMAVFFFMCAAVILGGVNKGIEATSRVIMPALICLIVAIGVFALTLTYTDPATGITRTGMDGLHIYMVPNLDGMTIGAFLGVLVDAMGQLFFSLSIAMGIMVAYGSYVSDKANAVASINQIEFFDTLVAFLAGMMIIPAVFTFMGTPGLASAGPGLIFVSLPKVFQSMGEVGDIIGVLFFLMVLFAAVTSAVSIYEAVVSSIMDKTGMDRPKATIVEGVIALIMAVVVCLGYTSWYFEVPMPTGGTGQILDIMDYLSNNILMPVIAIGTCIMIGWSVGPQVIIDEVEKNGESFSRRMIYVVMIKYIAPVLLLVLLAKSSGLITI